MLIDNIKRIVVVNREIDVVCLGKIAVLAEIDASIVENRNGIRMEI